MPVLLLSREEENSRADPTVCRVINFLNDFSSWDAMARHVTADRGAGHTDPRRKLRLRRLGHLHVLSQIHGEPYHMGTIAYKLNGSLVELNPQCGSVPKRNYKDAMTTTNRIRELREAAGMSLDELAKRANLSRPQISRLEMGTRRLNMDAIVQIAQALEVAPEEIVGYASLLPTNDEVTPATIDGMPDVLGDLRNRGLNLYRIETDSLALLGYYPGRTITVDMSPAAIQARRTGDLVIARVTGADVVVLRQFIEPDMLITQRPSNNLATRLAERSSGLLILGVVVRSPAANA